MNTITPQNSHPCLKAENAWALWRQLNKLVESLWNIYEQEFLQFCINECNTHDSSTPLPFEKNYDKKAA